MCTATVTVANQEHVSDGSARQGVDAEVQHHIILYQLGYYVHMSIQLNH